MRAGARLRRGARGAGLRTAYLRRYVLNGQELLDWAAANGAGGEPVSASALHVTLAYSLRPVDWSRIAPDPDDLVVEEPRRRRVELIGGAAAALMIHAPALIARHKAILLAGASGEFLYRPHVTFAFGAGGRLPMGKPFAGPLHLGPEVLSPAPERGTDV